VSYLLFDSAYTRALVDIGHRDASERIAEIEGFLSRGAGADEGQIDARSRRVRRARCRLTAPRRVDGLPSPRYLFSLTAGSHPA
jgi:hypothetical protein